MKEIQAEIKRNIRLNRTKRAVRVSGEGKIQSRFSRCSIPTSGQVRVLPETDQLIKQEFTFPTVRPEIEDMIKNDLNFPRPIRTMVTCIQEKTGSCKGCKVFEEVNDRVKGQTTETSLPIIDSFERRWCQGNGMQKEKLPIRNNPEVIILYEATKILERNERREVK